MDQATVHPVPGELPARTWVQWRNQQGTGGHWSILVIVYITSSGSSLQKQLHTAVIVLEKDNISLNYPILNSRSLKTVSSIDVF